MKKKIDVVALTHRIFKNGQRKRGGFDKIVDFFSVDSNVLLIEHPLSNIVDDMGTPQKEMIVSLIRNGKIEEIERIKMVKLPSVLGWIGELITNTRYLSRISGRPILIAADPLNALVSLFTKKRFSKTYFHCIDYSKKRFNNILLNCLYKLAISIVVRKNDVIGVVSSRIRQELIENFNCQPDKIFYIPNSPTFKEMDFTNNRGNVLICTSNEISETYQYNFIIDLVHELKKDFEDILLYAFGTLNQKEYVLKIKDKIHKYSLEKNVIFTGFLSQDEMGEVLLKSKIGLCFYSGNILYNVPNYGDSFYGDSLKMREYALYGIPIISNGKNATDDEMLNKKAGFVIKDLEDASDKIEFLLKNKDIYKQYHNNCISWAREVDKNKILDNLKNKLYEKN